MNQQESFTNGLMTLAVSWCQMLVRDGVDAGEAKTYVAAQLHDLADQLNHSPETDMTEQEQT